MQGQGAATLASRVAEIEAPQRLRVERMVHEAMLTMRMAMDRDRPPPGRSCWPDYVYERDDYGDRASIEEVRGLVPLWRPSARHIDAMDWVFLECFSKFQNPLTEKAGLSRTQWMILELRAWQVTFQWRGGWRHIASSLEIKPGVRSWSREWCRIEHGRLMDFAVVRAREDGRA